MTNHNLLGIQALKAGDKAQARNHLAAALRLESQDVPAWLAMSFAVDNGEQQQFCLGQVLKLDPENQSRRRRVCTGQNFSLKSCLATSRDRTAGR